MAQLGAFCSSAVSESSGAVFLAPPALGTGPASRLPPRLSAQVPEEEEEEELHQEAARMLEC